MIDSLFAALPKATASGYAASIGADGSHVVVTLHRPSNVDDADRLRTIAETLRDISATRLVLFPAHPRTQQRLKEMGVELGNVRMMDPIAYPHMLDLVRTAHAVITDSGGLQEETTALGIPCFTLRPNTERPITVTEGTNQLVFDVPSLRGLVASAQRREPAVGPAGWDGRAAERIVKALRERPA
jgi:UDP-N-acetylglucosamine 2-epimerase (non-hydrolysing)